MGMSIAEIRAADTKPLSIDVKGGIINFEYTPAAFTPELEELTLDAEGEFKLNTPSMQAMVAALIVSWDLTVDAPKSVIDKKTKKERPYDATLDGPLEQLPIEIGIRVLPKSYLMIMLDKIGADLSPKPATEEL